MILSLNSQIPLVWRNPTSLQMGIDRVLLVCENVTLAEENMLRALKTGVSFDGLAMIGTQWKASKSDIRDFLDHLEPVLSEVVRTPPLDGFYLVVTGETQTAKRIRELLAELGACCSAVVDENEPVDLAIIVSSFAVSPRTAAWWLRRDIPHLAVVFSDEQISIGPLVEPGFGPCLQCIEEHKTDTDPAWPTIGSQIIGQRAPTENLLCTAEVVAIIARCCVNRLCFSSSEFRNLMLKLRAATGKITYETVLNHPECGCQALPETAKANARRHSPNESATTRERASLESG